jgi:hypothetical protein
MRPVVPVLVFAILFICLAPCFFDFFLLLFDQEALHRIVVVVFLHQKCKFPFFW